MEDEYSSLQEEADAKSRKLNKLVTKFKSVHHEIQEIAEEQQREREDMLDTLRTLTRQVSTPQHTHRPLTRSRTTQHSLPNRFCGIGVGIV